MLCPHLCGEERKTRWGRAPDGSPMPHCLVEAQQKQGLPFVMTKSPSFPAGVSEQVTLALKFSTFSKCPPAIWQVLQIQDPT